MAHQHSSCTLDQLIVHLTEIRNTNPQVNKVIFWDQFSTVTIPLSVLCTVENDALYVGGLHMNGDDFCKLDPFVIDGCMGEYPKECSISDRSSRTNLNDDTTHRT